MDDQYQKNKKVDDQQQPSQSDQKNNKNIIKMVNQGINQKVQNRQIQEVRALEFMLKNNADSEGTSKSQSYLQGLKKRSTQIQVKNHKLQMELQKSFKTLDSMIGFISMFNLLVVLTKNYYIIYRFKEICIAEQYEEGSITNCRNMLWYDKFEDAAHYDNLLWFVVGLNIVTVCLQIYRHRVWKQWMIETSPERQSDQDQLGIASSYMKFWSIILILIVSPIPGMADTIKIEDIHFTSKTDKIGSTYYLEDFLSAFMLFRFVFLYNQLINNTIFREQHAKNLCLKHNFYPDIWFILKKNLAKSPEKTILMLFLLSVIFFSQMILIFEYQNFIEDESTLYKDPIFLSVYCVVITISTVGYGDVYPKTVVGRIIIMFAALWGAILISFVVVVSTSLFDLSEDENEVIDTIEKQIKAVKVISSSFRFFKHKKHYFLRLKKQYPTMHSNFVVGLKLTEAEQDEFIVKMSKPDNNRIQQLQFWNSQESDVQRVQGSLSSMHNARSTMVDAIEEIKKYRRESDGQDAKEKELEHKHREEMTGSIRTIKKEVSDMADTMDILVGVIKKMETKLDQLDDSNKNSTAVNQSDIGIKDEQQDQKVFVKSMDQKTIINRHDEFYGKFLQRGKQFKTSNRDDVLLGNDGQVSNQTTVDKNLYGSQITVKNQKKIAQE